MRSELQPFRQLLNRKSRGFARFDKRHPVVATRMIEVAHQLIHPDMDTADLKTVRQTLKARMEQEHQVSGILSAIAVGLIVKIVVELIYAKLKERHNRD